VTTIAQALAAAHAHHERGELPQAEVLYRQVLAAAPGHAEASHLLGILELQSGRVGPAIALLESAVAKQPDNTRYRGNLGSVYFTAHRFGEARELLEATVRDDPTHFEAFYNLGVTLAALGELPQAETRYRSCLRLNASHRGAHNNLGNLLRELGRYDEALVHLERALGIDPNAAQAHYNRALVWLSQGRFAEGWPEYEWRWRCPEFRPRHQQVAAWDGSPQAQKTLLIHAEQGLGDTMQFIRYLPAVVARVPNTVVEVQPGLIPLLRQSGYPNLIAQGAPLPPFDLQLPLASLPRVMGTALETIPRDVPYLRAAAELISAWRGQLGSQATFKVGIAWQGNPNYREDRFRSIALAMFAPLAGVPGVELFSLQKGVGAEQVAALGGRFRVVDLGSQIDQLTAPFLDTAAIMKCLDLVITSDTAIAHLAGALAVPVWVALRYAPDWRWMASGRESPWYPTMRLFRQPTFGDWLSVFDEMAGELGAVAAGGQG
jgi:tetratricopeptide (TPR) repeat protein